MAHQATHGILGEAADRFKPGAMMAYRRDPKAYA
jgi:hypothetical protein